jgi:hypothetical protein
VAVVGLVSRRLFAQWRGRFWLRLHRIDKKIDREIEEARRTAALADAERATVAAEQAA